MKTHVLLVLFAVASCDYYETAAPDASVVDAHAMPDAAPTPQPRGCDMGNLPNSRTITVDDSDPVPSGLLNELQDNIVANSLKLQTMNVGGEDLCVDLGAPTRAGSLWTFPIGAVLNATTNPPDERLLWPIRLPVGMRVVDIFVSSNVGNSSMKISIVKRSIGDGGVTVATLFPTLYSGGGGWALNGVVGGPATFNVLAGFSYTLKIENWHSGPAFPLPLLVDGVQIQYDRQP